MPLTIAITANPSGLTLTISGSDGGTVSARKAPFTGEEGATIWAAAGSRTGNGTISLTLAPGHYWIAAIEASVWTAPIYAVVPSAKAVRSRCLDAVETRIRAIGLEVTDANGVAKAVPVYGRQNFAAGLTMSYPCVEVRRDRGSDRDMSALNNRDDQGYGVLVLIKARTGTGPNAEAAIERHDGWYQAIARAFRQQRLPGVIESVRCLVEEGPEIDETFPEFELVAGAMVIRCVCREVRGLGA